MKHRKPSRTQRAVANSSLPLATAAAVATFFASPAGAVPNEQPTTPNTPGPSQPGTTDPEASPQTTGPGQQNQRGQQGQQNQQPGVQTPDKEDSRPTPSQPGVTTPQQEPGDSQQKPEQGDQQLAAPTQPGVTTPRVAPLPVPGQPDSAQPAIHKDRAPGDRDRDQNSERPDSAERGDDQVVTPRTGDSEQQSPQNSPAVQPGNQPQVQQPEYTAPRNQAAPPAPVVEMEGPHAEIGAAVDGGSLVPGHVANTHHFRNEAGYVGTAGYSTPQGAGEAGVSVEFLDQNHVQVSSFVGGQGLPDNRAEHMIDTTGLNNAKAAVEHWIAAQPGGPAALEAAANYEPPQLIPEGDAPPQTINVGGVNTQWGGSLQY